MCDFVYIYVIYLYIVRTILYAIVGAISVEMTPEETGLWADI